MQYFSNLRDTIGVESPQIIAWIASFAPSPVVVADFLPGPVRAPGIADAASPFAPSTVAPMPKSAAASDIRLLADFPIGLSVDTVDLSHRSVSK